MFVEICYRGNNRAVAKGRSILLRRRTITEATASALKTARTQPLYMTSLSKVPERIRTDAQRFCNMMASKGVPLKQAVFEK